MQQHTSKAALNKISLVKVVYFSVSPKLTHMRKLRFIKNILVPSQLGADGTLPMKTVAIAQKWILPPVL
jgi:hypothetical protein